MSGSQRRISDLAREMASKNRAVVSKVATEMHTTEEFAREAMGGFVEAADIQQKIAETLIDKNRPRVEKQMRNLVGEAKEMSDELDAACDQLEKSSQRWQAASNEAIKSLREKRIAINSELSDTIKAIRDLTGMAAGLDKDNALRVLADFAAAGKVMRDAYGDMGLVRLADALLVLSESEPKDEA